MYTVKNIVVHLCMSKSITLYRFFFLNIQQHQTLRIDPIDVSHSSLYISEYQCRYYIDIIDRKLSQYIIIIICKPSVILNIHRYVRTLIFMKIPYHSRHHNNIPQ